MSHHDKMQPCTLSLFLGLAIQLGLYSVIETGQHYPCDLEIVEGKATRNPAVQWVCQGPFPCDVYFGGQLLYSLKCHISAQSSSYMCDGVCPLKTGFARRHFRAWCSNGGWSLNLGYLCRNLFLATTTNSPRDDGDDSSSRTVMWVVIMSVILGITMFCICCIGMKATRKRRQRGREIHRNRAGSPTMIYSVTLDRGPGQALSQSINDYMRRTSQGREPDCDLNLHLDRDLVSESLPSPTVVVKPPSYEEVISSDANEESKDIPNPNPPPYSEK